MPLDRLTFVALSVSNLDRSLNFYRDIVGIPLHEDSHDAVLNDPWYGGVHAAYSWTDGAYIHFAIYPSRKPNRPVSTAAQIGFHILNFDQVFARIASHGVSVVQQPRQEPWGRTARFLDPDGNIVSITEYRSEARNDA